mmetsp:Transcript_81228/g.225691  ORF Transcript_81228/g.225691 Transcript_81228/m.225691 type:complete len:200 (-) Transcript_81228:200-799(-)
MVIICGWFRLAKCSMSYAQGMYMPLVPLWIVKKVVGRYSSTSCLKARVSGSLKGLGPGFVSAGSRTAPGCHSSAQLRLRSTPSGFTRRQKSPDSTFFRDSGLPLTTIWNSLSCSTRLASSERPVSPQSERTRCKPDSGEMSSRECSPKRRKFLFTGADPGARMVTTSMLRSGPPTCCRDMPGQDSARRFSSAVMASVVW